LLNRETPTPTPTRAAADFDDTELNASIKGDFLITKKKIYLNNGSIGPVPVSTIKSITDFYLRYSEQGPDSNETNDYLDDLKKETRKRVADLINCGDDEIIFTQSTTEGINFIANGLTWKKGNRILLRNQKNEHPSNYLPWVRVAGDKNLKIDKFPRTGERGNPILEDLKESLESNDHRIVTSSHVMYNDGSITPLEEIGRIIKNKNRKTLFSVDGAQSVGAVDVDVKKMNCDFMSFPAFKWICGPLGIGVLYVNKEVMNEIEPVFVGAGSATTVELGKENKTKSSPKPKEGLKYHDYPEKYHSTFRNFPGMAGLESSIRYLLRIGMHNIIKKNKKISNVFRDEIANIRDIVIHEASEENLRSSMVCFSFKRKNNNSTVRMLVEKLQEKGMILAEREIGLKKVVRASPHFYNTEEEMIKTANEVKSILSKM
jgi:cysteine desulfurase/selenocysteine lyase